MLQAQYWHDPLAEQEYRDNSLFLADINNEGPEKNESYKENLAALDNLVPVHFTEDTIVDPTQSEAFGWFSPEDNTVMVPVQVGGTENDDSSVNNLFYRIRHSTPRTG